MKHPIYKIVLTGGPCAGKTTALARIREHFSSHGFRIYTVPETATVLLTNGLSFRDISQNQLFVVQSNMMQAQIAMEDTFERIAASTGDKAIVICDRGAIDPAAFINKTMWQAILDENNTSEQKLYSRYEAVIHLVTAAIGAEQFYTLENNAARSETPQQSAMIDKRLREVWLGHPHLRVIDNSTSFDEKINRVITTISNVVGVPEPIEIERKFLVKNFDIREMSIPYSAAEIEQTYLITPSGEETRIRKRGANGSFFYTHTIKKDAGHGKKYETERALSPQEYVNLLSYADPERKTIKKIRYCFLYENQYFELDEYREEIPGLDYKHVLEIELTHIDQEIKMPPFIEIACEATGDKKFSNYNLAKK
jgi:CYTH domain-containing protein/thymidylate kinase